MPSHSPFIPKAFQVDVLNSFWSPFKLYLFSIDLKPFESTNMLHANISRQPIVAFEL